MRVKMDNACALYWSFWEGRSVGHRCITQRSKITSKGTNLVSEHKSKRCGILPKDNIV